MINIWCLNFICCRNVQIDISVLKLEMLVAKNSILLVYENQEFNIEDIKKVVTEHIYPTHINF